MRRFLHIVFVFAAILMCGNLYAQVDNTEQQAIVFNKKIHNFGKISVNDGAQKCAFEFRNTSNKPVVINNIISTCGCTTPIWPKKPIMPGESGKVEVTYLNDQGPYPFDKNLTVYTSASSKPIILRITGLAYENERSLKEMFPTAIGTLGVKSGIQRGGQIRQGESKGGNFKIANISNKSTTVKFTGVSEGLSISIEPQTIAAGEIADVTYTIDTRAKENWGLTTYSADVLCNGVKAPGKIAVECMIIDNFSNMTKEEKNKGAMVLAQNSSFNFGEAAAGTTVTATFHLRNTGQSPLVLHKIDKPDYIKVSSPAKIGAGEKFTLTATIDTAQCGKEEVHTITLVTNSPNRPLVNLFITGKLK